MQQTLTSEPEDRMQTGTANRVRSKVRRDVREGEIREDPILSLAAPEFVKYTLAQMEEPV